MKNFKKVTKVISATILILFALIGYSIFMTNPIVGLIVIGFFVVGTFPLLIKLALGTFRKLLWRNEKKRQKLIQKAGNELLVKGYFDNHELYSRTRDLFSNLMKNKKMSREHILQFERILNEDLGDFAKEYKKLERTGKIKFANDAHRIYFKLKSPYLTSVNFNELYAYLDELKTK